MLVTTLVLAQEKRRVKVRQEIKTGNREQKKAVVQGRVDHEFQYHYDLVQYFQKNS